MRYVVRKTVEDFDDYEHYRVEDEEFTSLEEAKVHYDNAKLYDIYTSYQVELLIIVEEKGC